MSSSTDSPLGVGSLLSICDHIQMFQDAWQGHTVRADERPQKFMLHGPLMKRDSGFASFEAGMPASNDKKENLRERSFPLCAERYWKTGMGAAPSIAHLNNQNHHINSAARISHWECSVLQEEKLTKGFGVRIGQFERSRPTDASELIENSSDFGWIGDSKHMSSAQIALAPNNIKLERNHVSHSRDPSVSSVSTQDSLSSRKLGTAVTKRKKSFSEVDVGHDQTSMSSSDTSYRLCIDTKTVGQSRPTQATCISVLKAPGLQLSVRGSGAEEECDSQSCGTGRSTISSRSTKMDGLPLKTGPPSNCDQCTCQQSLPTPRQFSSTCEEKLEAKNVQVSAQGLTKDTKRGFHLSNAPGKQFDVSEKIISLDESEIGDAHIPQSVKDRQEKSPMKKPNLVPVGKHTSFLPTPSIKDLGSQIQLSSQDSIEDGHFAWQHIHSKADLRNKTALKPSMVDRREDLGPNKSCSTGLVNKKADTGAMGKSDGFFQAGENGHFVTESATTKRTSLPNECIPQGSLRLQQQLECEKMGHEFSKKELEHLKKDYYDFLRDLSGGKEIRNTDAEDGFSKFSALLQERERKKLTLEFEARLAAEDKARIYEASAEAAESRLLQLLDERTNLHLKFDEELEQKEVERIRLHSLFEKERHKSEAAKKELQDLKEKFASLLSRVPLFPEVKSDDLHEISLSPRNFFKLSDALKKRDAFEDSSKFSICTSVGECGKGLKKSGRIECVMAESSNQFKDREASILQQVRQQEMQLKTAEDAFQELERKLKHVDFDKAALKECSDPSQKKSKPVKHIEKATQTSCWNDGVYEKYNCVYQSPIFEHNHPKSKSRKVLLDETSEADSDERVSNSREQCEDQTDIEIRQLTEELKTIGADMLSVQKIPESNGNEFTSFDELKHVDSLLDKQMNEEELTNQALKRRLKEKTAQLNKVLMQHAKELQRMQNSSSQEHELNKQLATNLANAETKLTEVQVHYDGLLASLEAQLIEARKDVQELRKDADQLRGDLSESDKKLKELKRKSELKQVELDECRRIELDLKRDRETKENERNELSLKLQEAQKEVNEQASRVAEYLSINEELLDFSQRKENEVAALTKQVETLQQQILEKENVDSKLQVDFEEARKELNEVQKAYNSIESENELLKTKIFDNNLQLLQQEGTIATLTKQMADVMQGRDSMLEEAAQFHGYLQSAKYKEFELENKLRQSSTHIKDLGERLEGMESEILRSRSELAELKQENNMLQKSVEDKENEALGLRKSVNDLRKKVQDLEEEVMLKEGQIAIISSQNRESYEPY